MDRLGLKSYPLVRSRDRSDSMVPGLPGAERGDCFQGDAELIASHLLALGGGCRQSCPHAEASHLWDSHFVGCRHNKKIFNYTIIFVFIYFILKKQQLHC